MFAFVPRFVGTIPFASPTHIFKATQPLLIIVAGKKDKRAPTDESYKVMQLEKKVQNKRKKTAEERMAPSLFLMQYARLNLGPAIMGKLVSMEVQEAIYQLYKKDEDFWTVPRLAVKFGLKYNRTAAVLLSKIAEKKEEKRLAKRGEKLDFELERLMGEEFGWIATDNFVPLPGSQSLLKVHSDLTNLGDEVDFALIAKAHEKREPVPPPHQLPAVAPKMHIPARRISGPTRANKLHRSRLVIMDVDLSRKRNKKRKVPNEEKFMMIRDFDGSFRTPSLDERNYLCRELRSAPRLDRGEFHHYPLDIKKVFNPRIPLMKRTLRKDLPRHTPRGPNAQKETPKHIPRQFTRL